MSSEIFNASIAQWLKKLEQEQLPTLIKHVGFEVGENIVVGGEFGPGTPVDTGFCRSNWITELNHPPEVSELLQRPKGDKPQSLRDPVSNMAMVMEGVKPGDAIYYVNPVVYAIPLEYGHSKQAPAGMVRVVLANGQAIVDKVVREMAG